jgi:hypothetical protein
MHYSIVLQGDDAPEVELEFEACEDTILQAKVADKYVVAYLVQYDMYRPIEDMMGDCMGKMYRRGRDASRDEESNMMEALGLDRDGEMGYDQFEDEAQEFVAQEQLHMPYEDLELSCTEWDTFFDAVRERQKVMWEAAMEAGTLGNPDAVMLDLYEHSGQWWSISGHGMQCRWDTTNGAGVWVPDDCLMEEMKNLPIGSKERQEKAVMYCKQFLQEYNAIISGDVYGCVVQTHDEDGKLVGDWDSCWGFIGVGLCHRGFEV